MAQERAAAGRGGAGTGRGVPATYLRDRRNVHSLAQPTGEKRGVGGSGPPPCRPQGSALPAGLSLSDSFLPQRDWLRGERRGWQLRALGPAPEGTHVTSTPHPEGAPTVGAQALWGVSGAQPGTPWISHGPGPALWRKGTGHPLPGLSCTIWQRCPMPRILKEPEGWALSILR